MTERMFSVNNTKLYAFTNENLNSFCLSFYVRIGSIFENEDNNGNSHLLEHIIFRNIKRKYPDNFYDLLTLNGLIFSGITYREFMRFKVTGPMFGFDFACDVICSVFDELAISNKDYQLEKKRIKAEIRESNNQYSVGNIFLRNIWADTNNEKTILGYCKNLDKITLSKLEEFRRDTFVGNNSFFYVTGNVSEKGIEELISKIKVLDIKTGDIYFKNEINISNHFFNREHIIKVKDSSDYSAYFGFDIDVSKYSGAVIDLIYNALFTGENALIFKYISEDNPIAYSYDCTQEQYDNVCNIHFNYEFAPNKAEESIICVVSALNDLKQGKFNFDANLQFELANCLINLDDPDEINWSMAYYNHILDTSPYDYSAEKYGRYAYVTKEQVVNAAKEIFRRDNLTLLLEGRKSKLKTTTITEVLKKLDFEL